MLLQSQVSPPSHETQLWLARLAGGALTLCPASAMAGSVCGPAAQQGALRCQLPGSLAVSAVLPLPGVPVRPQSGYPAAAHD